ncbi:MAG TPA: thioredoxin domain-containing protein [Thermoleophilaceae bacterium]|jgi:protein-disulfide isomerase
MPGTLSPPLEDADHVLGARGAELELVMYADFQCPYCHAAQPVVRKLREEFGERLVYAFRHLPLRGRHPMAESAAEASEAAGAQGKFWEYHDGLYAMQPKLGPELYEQLAVELALDAARLDEDLREGRWRKRVERDHDSGLASGADGTPAFFVNGRLHAGAADLESLAGALTA